MSNDEALDRAEELVALTREEGADGLVVLRRKGDTVDVLHTGDVGGEAAYDTHTSLAGLFLRDMADLCDAPVEAVVSDALRATRGLETTGVAEYRTEESE